MSPPPRLIKPKIESTSNLDIYIEPELCQSIVENISNRSDYLDTLAENMKYYVRKTGI